MTINDMNTKTPTYLGAGIILMNPENNTFLLLKGVRTGVWSFSKGHPETGDHEAPLRTAVRETFEETGLRAGYDYNIIGNSIRFGKRPYWLGVMKHTDTMVTLSRTEHSAAAWMSWEEINNLNTNTNTDVRCWVKKSQSDHGEFSRVISLIHRSS
jgi:8-oxo-dGTP pyrophosphatase MutT (NUDIX family)